MSVVIDMKPILDGETDRIEFDCPWIFSETADIEGQYPDIEFTETPRLSGEVVNHSGYMKMSMTLCIKYKTQCARCLAELERAGEYSFEKNVAVKGTLQNEDNDDYILVESSQIELDTTAEELLMLELPIRHLCRDDCKGLCPKCGKDLNAGDCECQKKDVDPRLAVLAKLLQKD